MPVCVGARSKSRSRSPRHKLPLADDTPTPVAVADDTPTSQSATKTSFPASSKSIDHDTASFCARTAGNYRRSKRKSVKSATVLLTSKATHGRSFRKRTRSFVPILQFGMHISQIIMNYTLRGVMSINQSKFIFQVITEKLQCNNVVALERLPEKHYAH